MKALLLQFFWVCILFFGEISGRFNNDNGTVCRVSTALSTAWFTVGVYISKHYEDIVGCAFLEGWVGARSDPNELNTESFIGRGPQPDVNKLMRWHCFILWMFCSWLEKSSVTMFWFSEFGMCSKNWIAACLCVKWLFFVCAVFGIISWWACIFVGRVGRKWG